MTEDKSKIRLEAFPFGEFVLVEDLISFDGPILCHVKDGEHDYLSYWVDTIDDSHRWLIVPIDNIELKKYLTGNISLRNLVLSKEKIFLLDMLNGDYTNTYLVQKLSDDYLPNSNSLYLLPIPSIYNELIVGNHKEVSTYSNLQQKGFYSIENKAKEFNDFKEKISMRKNNLQIIGC